MKLFQISNMEMVKCCQNLFGCNLPSVLLTKRYDKFFGTVTSLVDCMCWSLKIVDQVQLSSLFSWLQSSLRSLLWTQGSIYKGWRGLIQHNTIRKANVCPLLQLTTTKVLWCHVICPMYAVICHDEQFSLELAYKTMRCVVEIRWQTVPGHWTRDGETARPRAKRVPSCPHLAWKSIQLTIL